MKGQLIGGTQGLTIDRVPPVAHDHPVSSVNEKLPSGTSTLRLLNFLIQTLEFDLYVFVLPEEPL